MADITQLSDAELDQLLNPTPIASAPADLSQLSDTQLDRLMNAQKPLGNVPGQGLEQVAPKAAATSTILGLSDYPGMVGNLGQTWDALTEMPTRLLIKGLSAAGALPEGKNAEDFFKQAQAVSNAGASPAEKKGYVNYIAGLPFPTGEGVAAPILEKTGKYEPESAAGQVGMTGLRTAVGSIGPGGWARGMRALTEGAVPTKVAMEALKGAAETAPSAFGIGAIADTATQLTGEPTAGMLAAHVAPILPARLMKSVSAYTEPTKAVAGSPEAQRQADIKFTNFAENPEAARANLAFQPKTFVEGAPFSTGEISGDRGLQQAQGVFADTSPQFATDLKRQQGERNAANVGALQGIAPQDANQMAPTEVLTRRANDIQSAHQANVRDLTDQARTEAANIPAGTTPEDIGQRLRDRILASEAEADRNTSDLYGLAGQNGLTVVGKPVADLANSIQSRIESSKNQKPLSGEEKDIFDKAAQTSDVENFSDLHDLEKRITNEVSRNKRSPEGDPATISRLTQLKGAIRDVMNNSADHQAAYEQSLVDQGQMQPQDTMASRLQQEADAFMARKYGTQAPPAAPAAPQEPTMTPEAAARYTAAKAAHATQMQTYGQGPVARILENLGFSNQFKMPASGIPKLAFSAGDNGYTNAQAFLRAANGDPAAISALEDAATMRLRERMGQSDTLTPSVLNAWRNQHANALRAIDEVSPGFSSRFDNAAAATAALEDVQSSGNRLVSQAMQGAAQKFLGITSPDEVAPRVGSLINSGPTGINQVLDAAGRDPQVLNGLRAAGVDYMQRAFANAGIEGGENIMSGPKLTKFLDKNTDALTALYGADGVNTMRQLAANFERAQDALSSQKTVGSPTFTKQKFAEQLRPEGQKAPVGTDLVIWYEFLRNALAGEPVSAGMAAAAAGAKSLFNAARERGVNNINDLLHEGLLNPEVGQAMLQRGIDAKGRINQDAVRNLVKSLSIKQQALTGSIAGQKQQQERLAPEERSGGRIGRATGGPVNLMALSKTAKKRVTQSTKDLLNEDDTTVARALEVANQHI